jgi:DNA invertase Pin-like site-specific DNA recombinase
VVLEQAVEVHARQVHADLSDSEGGALGNSYNGFSWPMRQRALRWLQRQIREGRRFPPTQCDVCLTSRGHLMRHSEDYAEPFGAHIGRWQLCYWCHIILHCKTKAPDAFQRYLEMLKGGQRVINGSGIQWAQVQGYLAGRRVPLLEPIGVGHSDDSSFPLFQSGISDPFKDIFAEGDAVRARVPVLGTHDAGAGLSARRQVVYGYLRVSTEEQANSGLGLDAQRAAILAHAGRQGLVVAAFFEDAGISGTVSLESRPGLANALNALRRSDTLLVAKRDRIARDTFISVLVERTVLKKGARIISTSGEGTESDDPSAIFTRRILDAVAELERALIAARTSAALQQKKARGERVGTIPFGKQLSHDGRLVEHAHEQAAVNFIQSKRAEGWTLQAIADELNRQGFRTRRGGIWVQQYCRRILLRR